VLDLGERLALRAKPAAQHRAGLPGLAQPFEGLAQVSESRTFEVAHLLVELQHGALVVLDGDVMRGQHEPGDRAGTAAALERAPARLEPGEPITGDDDEPIGARGEAQGARLSRLRSEHAQRDHELAAVDDLGVGLAHAPLEGLAVAHRHAALLVEPARGLLVARIDLHQERAVARRPARKALALERRHPSAPSRTSATSISIAVGKE
jgi:hypothetical protein